MYFPTRRATVKRIAITVLILASLECASADSLAVARFRADSTLATRLWQQAAQADSAAQVQRIQARTIWDLAVRNLQRDTAKAK